MKKTTYTTTRFDIENDFYVEVIPSTDNEGKAMHDFFLCKEDCGLKELMFGLYAKDCPPDKWERMIEVNVDDYIETFINDLEYWNNQPID